MKRYIYPSPVIADRIQQIFDEHGLKDGRVADILEMDRKTVLKYRRAERNPNIKFIRWLCSTYKIDANWLLAID